MATPEKKERRLAEKHVKISRINPDKIAPVFVNDFFVSHTDTEFFLTFSILEPIEVQSEKDLQSIKSVEAIAKIKIVLNPIFAEAVSKALSTNIENFRERFKKNADQNPSTR